VDEGKKVGRENQKSVYTKERNLTVGGGGEWEIDSLCIVGFLSLRLESGGRLLRKK